MPLIFAKSSGGGSYPSTRTWAFVPERPNAFTPARGRRPGAAGQPVFSDATLTGIRSHSKLGFGVSK